MHTKSSLWTRVLLIVGIIAILMFIFNMFYFRLDFTGDKRYTLSNSTKDILKNLEDPVTVKAYFTEELPDGPMTTLKEDFKSLLEEYNRRSGGNVNYEFINPNESEDTEREAQEAGIQPVQLNKRERDQMSQIRAYLGAILSYEDKEEVLPFIQPGAAMEYALSSSIKKLSIDVKPIVGIIQGHGEPPLQEVGQALQELSSLYNIEPVTLATVDSIGKYEALAIFAPKDSFSAVDFSKLEEFLSSGKGIFAAINRVEQAQGGGTQAINTGLETWLSSKGLTVNTDLVADSKCGAIPIQRSIFTTRMNFPYLPMIQNFTEHPISGGIEQVVFPLASSITTDNTKEGITYNTLALSSSKSAANALPVMFDINKKWTETDFPMANIPIAVTAEGKLSGDTDSRIVLVGDGDFVVNGSGQQQQRLDPNNINLVVNSIDWLADDTGLNELRTKTVTSRPIKKELTDGQREMMKWGISLLPLMLTLLYGLFRFTLRRRKQNKWRNESYA